MSLTRVEPYLFQWVNRIAAKSRECVLVVTTAFSFFAVFLVNATDQEPCKEGVSSVKIVSEVTEVSSND